jgi:prepilin-type N-terminal cleavage/methylation domain-containing protein
MKKGFTLIELMIVVAIIAIIAAIAIPSLLNARRNSNQSAAMAAVKNFSSAAVDFSTQSAEQYYWANLTANFGEYFGHVATKGGYNFVYISADAAGIAAAGATAVKFVYVASPVSYSTGRRAYYIDETNQLWEAPFATSAAFTAYTAPVAFGGVDFTVDSDASRLAGTGGVFVRK